MDGSTHRGQITIRIPNMNPAQLVGQPYPQQRNVSHVQQIVNRGYQVNQPSPYNRPHQSVQSQVVFQGLPLNQQQITINNNTVYAQPHPNMINVPQVRQIIYNPQAHPYPPIRQ